MSEDNNKVLQNLKRKLTVAEWEYLQGFAEGISQDTEKLQELKEKLTVEEWECLQSMFGFGNVCGCMASACHLVELKAPSPLDTIQELLELAGDIIMPGGSKPKEKMRFPFPPDGPVQIPNPIEFEFEDE